MRAAGILSLTWQAARLPIYALLAILEPVVRVLLGGAALLGLLMTFFFKVTGVPNFPFWTMLSLSIGFGLALIAYYALMRVLSPS